MTGKAITLIHKILFLDLSEEEHVFPRLFRTFSKIQSKHDDIKYKIHSGSELQFPYLSDVVIMSVSTQHKASLMVTCSVKLKNRKSLPPSLHWGPSHLSSSQLRLLHSSITMQSGLPNPQPLTCHHKLFTVPGMPSPPPSLLRQGLFLLLQSSSGHFRTPRQRIPMPCMHPPTPTKPHTILVNHIMDCCSRV